MSRLYKVVTSRYTSSATLNFNDILNNYVKQGWDIKGNITSVIDSRDNTILSILLTKIQ